MSVNVTVNGTTYVIPQTSETGWGDSVTSWIQAISQSTVQRSGGSFPLTAELDFGAIFGIKSAYVKSESSNPSAAGVFRLSNTDAVNWRNSGNSSDLALKPNVGTDGVLTFNGIDLVNVSTSQVLTNKSLDASTNTLTNINNAAIASAAAIAYTKLSLSGSIVNADINAAAAIAYSKLNLTGALVNADISASAAIAYSKLSLSASIVNADVSASAAIAYSKLTLTGAVVNADISSSAAIAYSKLNLATSILNADVSASAAIAYSKLNLTGAILNADISASAAVVYSKLSLSNSIVNADINSAAAIAYSKLSLTGSIVNADINASAAIAYTKLNLATSIVNADIATAAAIARSKIAAGTANQVIINDGSGNLSGVAPGSSGNVLTSNGTSWASATPGVASTNLTVASKTGAYTLTSTDQLILASGAAFTLTLPAASSNSGKVFYIKKTDASLTNIITVARAGSDTIDGATSTTLNTQYEIITIVSDGTATWNVIARDYPRNWVAWTPTFTGFGTATGVFFVSRRVGDSLEFRGNFNSGTSTATEARISLGYGGTDGNVTSSDSTKLPSISIVGEFVYSIAAGTFPVILGEQSKGYVTFGFQDGSRSGVTKQQGSSIAASGNAISLQGIIPVTGWN